MTLLNFIDKLRANRLSKIIVITLRVILGLAFIYPSIPKITGKPFTILSIDDPVGYFFDCLTRLPLYWNFLGWSQMICGILLVTQRFAFIGAVVFTGFTINIFFIAVALDMRGTPVVTFLMLCAGTLLLLWDYRKLKVALEK